MSGYVGCSCCGDVIMASPGALCDSCKAAGCGEADAFDVCWIPTCPECGAVASIMNDGKWHSNCDDDCENHGSSWEA